MARLLTGDILLGDILLAIFCWRYFFREPSSECAVYHWAAPRGILTSYRARCYVFMLSSLRIHSAFITIVFNFGKFILNRYINIVISYRKILIFHNFVWGRISLSSRGVARGKGESLPPPKPRKNLQRTKKSLRLREQWVSKSEENL